MMRRILTKFFWKVQTKFSHKPTKFKFREELHQTYKYKNTFITKKDIEKFKIKWKESTHAMKDVTISIVITSPSTMTTTR
jgi:hypothetical protein